jgi:hypothetical protein
MAVLDEQTDPLEEAEQIEILEEIARFSGNDGARIRAIAALRAIRDAQRPDTDDWSEVYGDNVRPLRRSDGA